MDNIEDKSQETSEAPMNEETPEQPEQSVEPADAVNVARYLRAMVRRQPHKRAVVYPAGWDENNRVAWTHLTFEELDKESDCLAFGLEKAGIVRGLRTILMVRPSLEFFALTYALFKVGAVPVIVDPGMGLRRMMACLHESRAAGFIGVSKAHMLRKMHPKYFKSVSRRVTVGRRWFWGGPTLQDLYVRPWKPFPVAKTTKDETAAILFTTGSTGPAKGAVYTHGMFDAQVRSIGGHFGIAPDEIDLPTFPLFSLFDPALGMTAIIPDMDPTRPAHADPKLLIDTIYSQAVTNMFASPALLNRLGTYGEQHNVKLPGLKRVISAGAPVSPDNIGRFAAMLSEDAAIHTPYGATEAMPVLSIESREILSDTKKFSEKGFGMCVGRPLEGVEVRIIKITDAPIETWSDDLLVPEGDIGEITVRGDIVSRNYFEKPNADALSKIRDNGGFRHRMGDLGWQDSKGRIWFCGRKSHRVISEKGVFYTIPCEAIFNNHPAVFRSALVGAGQPPRQIPVICIELKPEAASGDRKKIEKELMEAAAQHVLTQNIEILLFHDAFPVDIRHNSKIFREQLAQWAARKLL